MKWIQPEVLALQSGHRMQDRRSDRRSETNIPPTTFVVCVCVCVCGGGGGGGIITAIKFSIEFDLWQKIK